MTLLIEWTLLFIIHINDITDEIESNILILADDTSFLLLNKDFEKI